MAYRAHFPALMQVAFLMTGSNEVAEDLVQDVFLRCADRIDQLDHPASYLRVAVVNACRSRHRRESRVTYLDGRPAGGEPETDGRTARAGTSRRRAGSDTAGPDLSAESLALRQALLRLNDRQRAAVVLRYFAGLSHDEVAAALDCRPATSRSLLHRALIELRGALDD